jgi:hypothetical protein
MLLRCLAVPVPVMMPASSSSTRSDVCRRVVFTQTLAHTALIVAAMTAHGEVVAWCVEKTAARPWIVAKALVCVRCCISGSCTLSHACEVPDHRDAAHDGWTTAAVLAACCAGDLSLLRRLMRDHAEGDAGVRDGTMRDEVRAMRGLTVWRCGLHRRVSLFLILADGCVFDCCCSTARQPCCWPAAGDTSTSRDGSLRRLVSTREWNETTCVAIGAAASCSSRSAPHCSVHAGAATSTSRDGSCRKPGST